MNKTAVEWLVTEINKLTGLTIQMDEPIIETAKLIEKEQVLKAINLTIEYEYTEQTWANCKSVSNQAEQYYNQIFTHE